MTAEIFKAIFFLLFIIPTCYMCYSGLRFHYAIKRMLKTVEAMSKGCRNEIEEHSSDYWLNILNQDASQSTYPLCVFSTKVLTYDGHDFFFEHGTTGYRGPFFKQGTYRVVFFLIAVGKSAVELLSEQDHIFRRISGSDELAAFSIYRYSDFTDSLLLKGGRRIGPG